MPDRTTRLLVTPGEPGGIGPDIVCQLSCHPHDFELVAVADPAMLADRATALGIELCIETVDLALEPQASQGGRLRVAPVHLSGAIRPGTANPAHAGYVLRCLDYAIDSCLSKSADAVVTGPVNKASIIESGVQFSGHTEYFAERTQTGKVVMMLASRSLRVALATTHLPLSAVPAALNDTELGSTIEILAKDLSTHFSIETPRILVCGLNPHAGEQGHLGREEIDIIEPCLQRLRARGLDLLGPLPADTAFTAKYLADADAVLAMYHDQGLPVIKYASFGETVNVTLGLPIIRTSVDHGTALDLAGSGRADDSSLAAALDMAAAMVRATQIAAAT